jgi:NADH dehydrogenase FAD-containing subunit
VVLVSPFPRQFYSGMLPGCVAGHYRAADCAIPLLPLAAAAGVRFVESSAVSLDAARRCVSLADGRIAEYELLSLDTGGSSDRQRIPGAREHGLFVRPVEHFATLVDGLFELAAQRMLDIVVIGAGAAGFEIALALQHRLGGDVERARIALVTGGAEPLAGYPGAVIRRGLRALAAHRITVIRDTCTRIDGRHAHLAHGARLACDAPVIASGADPPAFLAGSGLALDARGFVATGATLQSVSHAEVFAVGDVASRSDVVHARSGVHAVRAGPVLALNLRRCLGGGELHPHPPPVRSLNLLSCGGRSAIAAWGGVCFEGRAAWRWKDRIDRAFIRRFAATPWDGT